MLYFVINPGSSSGNGTRIWKECETILKNRGVAYQPFFLKGAGDASSVAAHIRRDLTPCTVVIVGGDGTINEFVSGIPDFQGLTLACIPTGSANDFAKGMHLPSKPEDLINMILDENHYRLINIGITESGEKKRCFAISSGIGFDAAVCHSCEAGENRLKKFLNFLSLGKLVYLVNALRMLFSMRFFGMKVITDQNQLLSFDKVCFAAAMNTRYEGGGFMFAPEAVPDDDALDLFIAEGLPKWKILLLLPTAFSGRHAGHKGIHIIRCRKAVISCQARQCVHTDGEYFGDCSKLSFSLHKDHLKIIA